MMTSIVTGGGAPFTIGDTGVVSSGGRAGVALNLDNPAPRSGTITSVTLDANVAGTLYVFTGTWDGTAVTPTAVSSLLTATAGGNTFPVSLSITSGGYLCFAVPSGSAAAVTRGTLSGTLGHRYINTNQVPTVGVAIALSSSNTQALAVQGTGS